MLTRSYLPLLGVVALSSCSAPSTSSASAGAPPVASADASASAADASGAPSCDDPRARPDSSCGTLSWTTSTTTSRKRNHHVTLLATTNVGTFLYSIGGFDGNTPLRDVDRIALTPDGALGAGNAEAPLRTPLGGLTGAVASNVLVVADGMGTTAVVDACSTAVVHDDGSLGPWTPQASMRHARFHGGSFARGDKVYVLGGFDASTLWDDVIAATVTADGTIAEWTPAGKLPGPRSHFGVSFVDGYVFLSGGLDQREISGPVPSLSEVARARVDETGTLVDWTPMPPLPVTLSSHATFFYGGYLYVAGGLSGSPDLREEKRVWRAAVDESHALGAWEAVAPLPLARAHVHQLPVFGRHVYSLAGATDLHRTSTSAIHVGTFE